MTARPVKFTFDSEAVFDGVTDDTLWNGFLNVKVTPAELDRIVEHFRGLVDAGLEDADVISSDYWPPVGPDGMVDLRGGFATIEVES